MAYSNRLNRTIQRNFIDRPPVLKRTDNTQTVFNKITVKLIDNGNLQPTTLAMLGGPQAALEIMNALNVTVTDKTLNYSFCAEANDRLTLLKNKQIIPPGAPTQENKTVDAKEMFKDPNSTFQEADICLTPGQQKSERTFPAAHTAQKPTEEPPADLTALVKGYFVMDSVVGKSTNKYLATQRSEDVYVTYRPEAKEIV